MVKINFQNNVTKANADTFNTMQDNIEDAINNVSIDLDDEVSTTSTNGIENQAITNYVNNEISEVQQDIADMQIITEGSGTPNNTYVSSVENNKWTRYGNVVCFSFIIATNNTWDLTSVIFSGLPRAKNGSRFMGLWANNTTPLRLEITENGELKNSWGACPTSSQTVEAYVCYITKD